MPEREYGVVNERESKGETRIELIILVGSKKREMLLPDTLKSCCHSLDLKISYTEIVYLVVVKVCMENTLACWGPE